MRRGLVLAGLILLLTGCGGADERAPFAESRIPPSLAPRFWAPEGWAWGLIAVGDAPAQRYGVSSTMGTPRGNILILADDRELAEAWFETARDLNGMGYTVWVMERSGQGGSGRYAGPRDLIHAPTFDDDVAATRALVRTIVQADSETPLTIVGQGVGGVVALAAVQDGAPAARLVLSSPRLEPTRPLPAWPQWLMKAGVGRLPAGVGQGWKRDGPDAFKTGLTRDRQRGAVQMAWQTANPDLRMGGHSLGWGSAFAALSKTVEARLGATRTPTLLLVSGDAKLQESALSACRAMPACTVGGALARTTRPIGGAPFLEADDLRNWWLRQVSCATPEHPRLPSTDRDARCPVEG